MKLDEKEVAKLPSPEEALELLKCDPGFANIIIRDLAEFIGKNFRGQDELTFDSRSKVNEVTFFFMRKACKERNWSISRIKARGYSENDFFVLRPVI